MRYVAAAVVVSLMSTAGYAQQATCKLQAVEKKLTGPPLTTFLEKCGDDAQKACEQLASARHLEEPAKTIFINNCVKASIG
jgi:hypothetical protein